MRLEAWSGSHVGLVRQSNQDFVGCYPELQLAIVADGMGGRSQGEIASRMAVEVVHAALAGGGRGEPLPWWRNLLARQRNSDPGRSESQQLGDAIERANLRIFDAGKEQRGEGDSMGTTIVALRCAVDQEKTYWAHVGDSRLYRWRDGELRLLTADHTGHGQGYWGQPFIPIDLPHTNRLLRALGIEPSVDVTTGIGDLRVGDLYLLCSDGISGPVTVEALQQILATATDLAQAGGALIQSALDGGGRDNATVALVRVISE